MKYVSLTILAGLCLGSIYAQDRPSEISPPKKILTEKKIPTETQKVTPNINRLKDDLRPNTSEDALESIQVKPDWAKVQAAIQSGQISSATAIEKRLDRPNKKSALAQRRYGKHKAQARDLRVPVLIPVNAITAENTQFVTRTKSYSFTADYPGGISVNVMSMCSGFVLPHDHPMVSTARTQTVESLRDRIQGQFGEEGYVVNFSAFGCGYQVTASCAYECDEQIIANKIVKELGVLNAR